MGLGISDRKSGSEDDGGFRWWDSREFNIVDRGFWGGRWPLSVPVAEIILRTEEETRISSNGNWGCL